MATQGTNGTAVVLAVGGAVLVYSGVKGKHITTTFRDLIAGNNPAQNTAVDLPITGGSGGSAGIGGGSTSTGSGKRLTPKQIYDYAIQAGFNPMSAVVVTAISMAEDPSGDPASLNNNPGTGDLSYGLMQINMIGNLGPQRLQQFGITSYDQLRDPLTNMRAAYIVSNHGTSFQPWTTFTSGAYLQHLDTARAAAGA